MIKKILGILICMLLLSSPLIVTSAKMTRSGTIAVSIPVGPYTIEHTAQGDLISVDGYGSLHTPGAPSLPSRIFSIAIPPGATVTGIRTQTTDAAIPGVYGIVPAPLPRAIGPENPQIYQQQQQDATRTTEQVYTSHQAYPASIAEIMGIGGYRKYHLVDVRITPITYEPMKGSLVLHSAITLSIDYTIPEGAPKVINDNMQATEATAKDIILNYQDAQAWYPSGAPTRGAYDYVIVTTDALTSAVQPLADWESTKNHDVNVVTTSWIDSNYQGTDLAAKIRSMLLEKYPSSEWGVQYVCLVGSYTDVPMRRTAQDVGYGAPETDYYYAELSLPDSQSWDSNGNHQYGDNSDNIDFEAEVSVGRIPWSDPAIVQSICEKSAAYEQNTDDAYKKNILLLGAYFWADTDNAVLMEAKINHDWMQDWTKTRLYEDAQSSYPCDADLTYANVQTYWSTGTYAFVDWAGHGSPDAAYELYPEQPFIDETSVAALNDQYPAIVFEDSCSNSDTDYLNIGQALMKNGGVGVLGSNKVAFGCPGWSNPMSGSSQSLDYFFTIGCTSTNYTQGQAHQNALHQMYVNNLWDYTRYEMFEWGSLWGNPDLTMGPVTTSPPPSAPVVSGPKQAAVNAQSKFTATSTDPNGDQIYYRFTWGDGTSSDWVGPYPSGTTGEASHAWSIPGQYIVKARAKDVNGATGDSSEPFVVTVVIDSPPGTPMITGPSTGKPHQTCTYTIQAIDPEGDNISYYIDWGDGKYKDWFGPYSSGQDVNVTHTWAKKGAYEIRVGSQDCFGMRSQWGTLHITMPYQPPHRIFVQWLFDHFPHAFPLLRLIFNNP